MLVGSVCVSESHTGHTATPLVLLSLQVWGRSREACVLLSAAWVMLCLGLCVMLCLGLSVALVHIAGPFMPTPWPFTLLGHASSNNFQSEVIFRVSHYTSLEESADLTQKMRLKLFGEILPLVLVSSATSSQPPPSSLPRFLASFRGVPLLYVFLLSSWSPVSSYCRPVVWLWPSAGVLSLNKAIFACFEACSSGVPCSTLSVLLVRVVGFLPPPGSLFG